MYFKYNNINLYYEKIGNNKKSLLILPGWGNNRNTFNKMINILKNNYTIYIFDYPGFGNSIFPDIDLTIYDYSKLFISFINKMKIKNPTIIAHSFGGRIAITMNGYFNIDFKKLILIDSAGIKPIKSKKQLFKEKIYKKLKKLGYILPKKIRNKYHNFLINIFGSKDYKNIDPNQRKTFINIVNEDLTKYLNHISSETLLIWGENDIDTPIENAYIMDKRIPNSALIMINNAHHFCYIEKPNYINLIIYEFLK